MPGPATEAETGKTPRYSVPRQRVLGRFSEATIRDIRSSTEQTEVIAKRLGAPISSVHSARVGKSHRRYNRVIRPQVFDRWSGRWVTPAPKSRAVSELPPPPPAPDALIAIAQIAEQVSALYGVKYGHANDALRLRMAAGAVDALGADVERLAESLRAKADQLESKAVAS
jgi:hypothetical protein